MRKTIYNIAIALLLVSCSSEVVDNAPVEDEGVVTITSSIAPFVGQASTRVNVEGDGFLDNDYIRVKIICPFVSSTERGEANWTTSDAFFYLKRSGSTWTRVVAGDGFDLSASYSASSSPDISEYYEVQQTPYVYVATTWSEERRFVAPNASGDMTVYDHLTPVFHADQRKEKHYRASDVLWAQTFMQTGAWNIHLGFQHKMACIDITIDDTNLPDTEYEEDRETVKTPSQKITGNAVLTLEGMPDIDQAEIVIGDYYADASKSNTKYGYQEKSSCCYDSNGKVLGVAVSDETAMRAKVAPLSGLESRTETKGQYTSIVGVVPNTGTYIAFRQATKHYRIIVPPCTLSDKAVFWLRDGSRRFTIPLDQRTFEEGQLYEVKLKLGEKPKPEPEPGSGQDDQEDDPEGTE